MHEKVLEEICEGCNHYCILKEIMLHNGMTDRTVIQVMCIDKFKYDESNRQGHDIGNQIAHELWIEKGYAREFSDIYEELKTHKGEENISYKEIYWKLMH